MVIRNVHDVTPTRSGCVQFFVVKIESAKRRMWPWVYNMSITDGPDGDSGYIQSATWWCRSEGDNSCVKCSEAVFHWLG